MQTQAKMAISTSGLKVQPIGLQHVYLNRTGEHFSINRPNSFVKNLIFGTMYIEQVGELTVTNYQTGEVCVVEFKAEGWGGKNKQCLEGYTYDSLEDFKAKNKLPRHYIFGTWTGSISFRPMKADGM